jgi:hypothetical protein
LSSYTKRWDDETAADPDSALQQQHAAEMSDEIPY